jgi:pimeloyl-ACP methyl ester carboxylesterase
MPDTKRFAARLLAPILLACCTSIFAGEPDFAREARLAEQIVDAIFDGEPEWLEADGREFLGIYTQSDTARPGVVILHGRGFHPDWADAVNPLRVGLAERGYSTLSLQMPVLEKEAKYYDYVPLFGHAHARIEAGIAFLHERGHEKIVLIAHSCGAHMAMDWIAASGDGAIDAFVGLGMGATDYRQPLLQRFPLERMRVPVLDLYGEAEYPAVIRMAPERKAMIEAAGNDASQQSVLPGADHYFKGKGGALVEAVAEWLDQL